MKDIEGQMNLFDILPNGQDTNEPPALLRAGQDVFMVVKGDVTKYMVLDETWICGENYSERGYRLQADSGIYNATWNKSIGVDCFTDYESARKTAEAYLIGKDVIMAESITPIETVAYSYIRGCDKRKMIAFYSELDSGMVYIKEFMTYNHMVAAEKKKKAIKQFMEQTEFKYCDVEQIEYEPHFKNMYRVREQKNLWMYGEAGYGAAVG